MFANWSDHLSASTPRLVVLLLTVAALLAVVGRIWSERRTYGTLSFLGAATKWTGVAVCAALALQVVQLSRPYAVPATGQLAVVLGNTQNSPAPQLGHEVSKLVESTMLLHKGETAQEVLEAFTFVSATGHPEVVPLASLGLPFVDVSRNDTRAKRDVRKNAGLLQEHLKGLPPADNGANYLEAILVAAQNVDPGTNILVVGSGLSDSGDLDFAHDNLLTNENRRTEAVEELADKYGSQYLAGVTVSFSGLGDTAEPQYPLSEKQRGIVREVYEQAIKALGGRVEIDTRSLTGSPVSTEFVVDATDTECGPLDRTFTEDAIEFVSDEARYVDADKVGAALQGIVDIYNRSPQNVTGINIAGFIANPSQAEKISRGGMKLSRDRARAVLRSLADMGVARSKLHAEGRGFGPHNDPDRLELDRMVKVTIDRDNPDC
ncbi:hypothetical protein [Nocardioides sp. J9]|uniref:hypothetical protein n=1 Tax=Nocardioides sp. J9 TaxID=935844 RepID=UPI001646CD92|nr:hypothetical protein [Nocardioides sp. J9]